MADQGGNQPALDQQAIQALIDAAVQAAVQATVQQQQERTNELQQQLIDTTQQLLAVQAMQLETAQVAPAAHRRIPRFPPFNPSNYEVSFPLLAAKNGEMFLTLLGRDDVVKKINDLVLYVPSYPTVNTPKYSPIIISTSRGMGKTFLLKMIGMQKVKQELENEKIKLARDCGRVLSFDFSENRGGLFGSDGASLLLLVKSFFPRLMIHYLCRIFSGTQVDGIEFHYIEFEYVEMEHPDSRFNEWKEMCLRYGADKMMEEYIRLTNIAFFGQQKDLYCAVPPVFLLDEVQNLCVGSGIPSTINTEHTLLSLLLTQLSGIYCPISISTGTNDGNILSITEMSKIVPRVLSLTPLVNESDYMQYWTEMTNYYNEVLSEPIPIKGDEDLINALVYASYQVPRLLNIAHKAWFNKRKEHVTNRENIIQHFEAEAIGYYTEMRQVLNWYLPCDISKIIMSCGVHWRVTDVENGMVPGTQIKWKDLINRSVVFPYVEDCFVFPFTLVWKRRRDNLNDKKLKIKEQCAQDVRNLQITDLFISYDDICKYNLYNLGVKYESLFVASLAVKYYLWTLVKTEESNAVAFGDIYDFDTNVIDGTESIEPETEQVGRLKTLMIDLSQGIFYPTKEGRITDNLPCAVIHNKKCHNAHHDIIIPTDKGAIPVSAKASFRRSSTSDIETQLLSCKNSTVLVEMLIWLYLGRTNTETKHSKVAFIDGSGVCNGLAFDMFKLVKTLQSLNNKCTELDG